MKNQVNTKSKFLAGVFLVCLMLCGTTSVQAQEVATTEQETITVKGTVSDEEGPLPGVNVVLKGTKIGTSTDFEGNYVFPKKLKKGDILVFTHISMESQRVVILNENSASKIMMKMDMDLAEIVITGAAATKKVYKSNKH